MYRFMEWHQLCFLANERNKDMNMHAPLNNHGMTLLEVMISMLILIFGILGLAPLFVISIEGNITARDNTYASRLIEQQIEYFVSLDSVPTAPYSLDEDFVYSNNRGGSETEGEEESEEIQNQLTYTRSTVIHNHTSDSLVPDGLCQITVSVDWNDHQNLRRSTSYSTFLIP